MAWRDAFTARSLLVDSAAAVGLTCFAARAVLDPPGPAFTGPVWAGWLAAAAVALPLVVRRRWPSAVLCLLILSTAVVTVLGAVGPGVIWVSYLPLALTLYSAAAVARTPAAVLALAGSLAGPAVSIPWLYARADITPSDAPLSEVPLWWQVELGLVGCEVITAWITGRLIRWRRAIRAKLADRVARDAVAEERLRIARELHDIVGHSMSLIAVKATVANHIADTRPAETRAALRTIEHTSRSALTEIRRMLDVLRSDDDPRGEFAPSPSIEDLSVLAGQLTAAGLEVDLSIADTEDLPAALDLTVYRIVQEAFTNVIKHADADRCWATVQVGDGRIMIKIIDDGNPRRPSGQRPGGHGLIGMRERVSMYGGTLTAGPRPEGGFAVIADIPYLPEGLGSSEGRGSSEGQGSSEGLA